MRVSISEQASRTRLRPVQTARCVTEETQVFSSVTVETASTPAVVETRVSSVVMVVMAAMHPHGVQPIRAAVAMAVIRSDMVTAETVATDSPVVMAVTAATVDPSRVTAVTVVEAATELLARMMATEATVAKVASLARVLARTPAVAAATAETELPAGPGVQVATAGTAALEDTVASGPARVVLAVMAAREDLVERALVRPMRPSRQSFPLRRFPEVKGHRATRPRARLPGRLVATESSEAPEGPAGKPQPSRVSRTVDRVEVAVPVFPASAVEAEDLVVSRCMVVSTET